MIYQIRSIPGAPRVGRRTLKNKLLTDTQTFGSTLPREIIFFYFYSTVNDFMPFDTNFVIITLHALTFMIFHGLCLKSKSIPTQSTIFNSVMVRIGVRIRARIRVGVSFRVRVSISVRARVRARVRVKAMFWVSMRVMFGLILMPV